MRGDMVEGQGTHFTQDLKPRDTIMVGTASALVLEVQSDSRLTLKTPLYECAGFQDVDAHACPRGWERCPERGAVTPRCERAVRRTCAAPGSSASISATDGVQAMVQCSRCILGYQKKQKTSRNSNLLV